MGDITYVGDHDFERYNQIGRLIGKLGQLRYFIPYYSEEIKKLYSEAGALASLEYEFKGKIKSKPLQTVEKPVKVKKTRKPVKTIKEKKKAKT